MSSATHRIILILLLTHIVPHAGAEPPKVLDDQLQLELFADSPDIVTPIGCCFDAKGRLLVIESHTHHRDRNRRKDDEPYAGPEKDRIRIVEDTDGDGLADSFRTFYEGTEFTMSLARGDAGWIYVATRAKIFRIRDTNGDDVADQEQPIAHLDTKGNYPHNGLGGLMLDGKGSLYFGLGENLGVDYRLIGRDGAMQRGSGEGGIFRCDLLGNKLTRVATGFWNPFGICKDEHDRIFAVGNDSDGRPPCRLVQVFEAADYGFQFRYGRSGRHPLQAWDGELPGTLPMIAGTGEAPCEMISYHGRLWIAGWGDNQIERYELVPKGASFTAKRDIAVRGDKNFRPVGFAHAPDGSVYVTDWVDRSYPVHGKGRIWKLSYKTNPANQTMPELSATELLARQATQRVDWDALRSEDVFMRQSAVAGLVNAAELDTKLETLTDARQRLGLLQALRWRTDHALSEPEPAPIDTLAKALDDTDPNVRLYAVRWASDAGLKQLASNVERQLSGHTNTTPELFLGTIASLEVLESDNMQFNAESAAKRFSAVLADERQSAANKSLALKMIPGDSEIDLRHVEPLLTSSDHSVQREAIRWLALSTHNGRLPLLQKIADSTAIPSNAKADALFGLRREVGPTPSSEIKDAPPASDLDSWLAKIGSNGDADAGWRVFFRNGAAKCANCHQYDGRGAKVGPDLTAIAARTSRRDVLQSILQPSRDVAPKFVPMVLVTNDGKVMTGLHDGYNKYIGVDGKPFDLSEGEIESKQWSSVSLMPEGIHEQLSLEDMRNLLALLEKKT